jgi:two-component system LytT family response regulator
MQLQPRLPHQYDYYDLIRKVKSLENKIDAFQAESQNNKIAISTADTIHLVSFQDIIRCEAQGNYCQIYLTKQKPILISKTLKSFSVFLINEVFIRTHQSHIVNKNFITKADKKGGLYLHLFDGTIIPVSRAGRSTVLSILQNI